MKKLKIRTALIADADDKQIVVASAYALTVITGPVGTARSKEETLEAIADSRYDAIILGLDMGRESHAGGLKLIRTIRLLHPVLKIVLMHDSLPLSACRAAIYCGASALVDRNFGLKQIPDALAASFNGRRYICRESRDCLAATRHLQALSPREQAVIERLARGQTTSEIASELGRSISTISSHKQSAIRKLNIESAKDLEQFLFDVSPLISTQTHAS